MPDGNNVDSTILKLAEQYQSTLVRSRELNDERATIRENVEKLGIDPKAFQVGLMMTRDMTKGERSDYSESLNRTLTVLDGREADLFGADEIAARNKRAEKRADKESKKSTPREVQDDKSDKNPRSNPKRGGAGKKGAEADAAQRPPLQPDGTPWPEDKQETGDELIERVAREENAKKEQREGASILDGAGKGSVDNGGENQPPKSQSQIAAEKLEAARLN